MDSPVFNNIDDFVLPNCSDILPSSERFFEVISLTELVLVSVAGVLTAAQVIMYLESVHYVHKCFIARRTRILSLWMLGLHPVFSVTALIAVCIPRSALICDLVATIYLSLCLRVFLVLMIHYHGGEDALLRRMEGDTINLRSPPLCCCFCCCPKLPLTRKTLHRIRLSVWQVAILRPFLVFLSTVMWVDGKYVKGKFEWDQAYPYLTIPTVISTMVAMYGLIILYRASRKHLQQLHIIPKFICVQFVLIFSNIQGFIFMLLSNSGIPSCIGILSSSTRGDGMQHLILIAEMFLLALLARCFYRRGDGAHTLADLDAEFQNEAVKENDGSPTFKRKDKYVVTSQPDCENDEKVRLQEA